MRVARLGALCLVVGVAGVLPAAAVGARGSQPATETQENDAGEFVVSYTPGTEADALAAIAGAGGTVVDVNEAVGLALVETTATTFLADVTAAEAVTGAASNHAVGTALPGMPHRFVEERPNSGERATAGRAEDHNRRGRGGRVEPLADLQWDMAAIGANADGAWRRATGRRVQVGVIDTGIDASHPDLAPNFNAALSRNFTMDIPGIDGDTCEVATCIDPADTDDGGHGTHVAGTIAAARNGVGIAGVAPEAELVNVRAGQDSGYFFLYETVKALTYSGDARLDVVNMSFYTDPWLFNCDSADDYLEGTVTDEELAEQAFTRQTITAALEYAHAKGVTLVAAAGNGHTDYSLPTRFDATSPDFLLVLKSIGRSRTTASTCRARART